MTSIKKKPFRGLTQSKRCPLKKYKLIIESLPGMTKYVGPSESARQAADKLMWDPQIYWPKAELLCSTIYSHHPFLSPDISPVRRGGGPKFTDREPSACRAPLSTHYGNQHGASLRDAGNLKAPLSATTERPTAPRSQGDRDLPTPGIARARGTVYELEKLRGQDLAWARQASEVWRGVQGLGSPQVGILEDDAKKGSLGLSPTFPPTAR